MTHTSSTLLFVRRLLLTDAVVSGATGALMAVGATLLEPWLGLPAPLLRFTGIALLPFAAVVAWLGLQNAPARVGVQAIIATNFAWVAGSVLLLVAGGVSPTGLGTAFVLFQAAVVFVLGELQLVSLRRSHQSQGFGGQTV